MERVFSKKTLGGKKMTEKELFEQNLNQLETFTQYVLEHPNVLDTLPKDARLVFLPKDNPQLRKENLKILKKDKINQPVAFVRMMGVPQIEEVVTVIPQLEVCHSPELALAMA